MLSLQVGPITGTTERTYAHSCLEVGLLARRTHIPSTSPPPRQLVSSRRRWSEWRARGPRGHVLVTRCVETLEKTNRNTHAPAGWSDQDLREECQRRPTGWRRQVAKMRRVRGHEAGTSFRCQKSFHGGHCCFAFDFTGQSELWPPPKKGVFLFGSELVPNVAVPSKNPYRPPFWQLNHGLVDEHLGQLRDRIFTLAVMEVLGERRVLGH